MRGASPPMACSAMLRHMQGMLASKACVKASACTQPAQAVQNYASNAAPHEENHIKSWREGQHLGRIHIDRPKALNAMSAGKQDCSKLAACVCLHIVALEGLIGMLWKLQDVMPDTPCRCLQTWCKHSTMP